MSLVRVLKVVGHGEDGTFGPLQDQLPYSLQGAKMLDVHVRHGVEIIVSAPVKAAYCKGDL